MCFRLRHSSFLSTSCFRWRWTYDKIWFTKPRNACFTCNMYRKNYWTLRNKAAMHVATSIQWNAGFLQNLHPSFWMMSVCCLSAERKALSTKTPPTRHGMWDKVGKNLEISHNFLPTHLWWRLKRPAGWTWSEKKLQTIWFQAQHSASNAMYSSCLSYLYNPIWITS